MQMHRIDKSRDEHFWSARVSRDLRLILHRTDAAVLVAYVDHHDRAYAWAERRRIEAHPTTGVVQIVEVRERVEEAEPERARLWAPALELAEAAAAPAPLFVRLTEAQLLSVGVPADWIAPVQRATEDGFYERAEHLCPPRRPRRCSSSRRPACCRPRQSRSRPKPRRPIRSAHPDARRRFLTIESREALEAALEAPWERWSVFLHPSQRALVERVFNGPARAAGTAGTGKTVVALHRAARIVRGDLGARLLLATFSEPLAANLTAKLGVLVGASVVRPPQVTVAAFEAAAHDLFLLAFARRPRIANADQVSRALADAAAEMGATGAFSQRFLEAEWEAVIDAWRVRDAEAYATVPRLGRRNRLGARQRQALWPVFALARARLEAQGLATWAGVFHALADHYGDREAKPFTHAIVDEAQDLSVAELRMMAAITPAGADRLFFAGDLGQRIFQQPFSWKALGVDVRGRSTTLKVNYRTSQQIRAAADRLLPDLVRDADGLEEDRRGAISVFEGPCARPSSWRATRRTKSSRWPTSCGLAPRTAWAPARSASSCARVASCHAPAPSSGARDCRPSNSANGAATKASVSPSALCTWPRAWSSGPWPSWPATTRCCPWPSALMLSWRRATSTTSTKPSATSSTSPAPVPATACWSAA